MSLAPPLCLLDRPVTSQTFDLRFPQPFSALLAGLKYPALDFSLTSTGLDCLYPTNFYDHVITITLVPILLVAIAPAVLYLTKLYSIKKKEHTLAVSTGSTRTSQVRRRSSLLNELNEERSRIFKICIAFVLVVAYLVLPVATVAILKVRHIPLLHLWMCPGRLTELLPSLACTEVA